jgi:hypothetical protein
MPSVPPENLVPPASLSVGSIRVLLKAISLSPTITPTGPRQPLQGRSSSLYGRLEEPIDLLSRRTFECSPRYPLTTCTALGAGGGRLGEWGRSEDGAT